jgi:FeS assembly protein IscX
MRSRKPWFRRILAEEDPVDVPLTTLHMWVTELPDFGDDPDGVTEAKLKAIQMAWYEEVKG